RLAVVPVRHGASPLLQRLTSLACQCPVWLTVLAPSSPGRLPGAPDARTAAPAPPGTASEDYGEAPPRAVAPARLTSRCRHEYIQRSLSHPGAATRVQGRCTWATSS